MEENVRLRLTGRQRDENGEETVTGLCADARLYQQNGSIYILYEEIQEDTGAVVRNTLKWKDSVLELVKKGAVRTRMVFQEGKECMMDYVTSYGCLRMGLRTDVLAISRKAGQMEIRAEYTLTSGGYPITDCVLTIEAVAVRKEAEPV